MFLILSLSFLVHQSQLPVILTVSGCVDFALIGLIIFHVSTNSMLGYQSLCLILLGVPQLFLLVYAVSCHLIIGMTLVFIFQNVDDVNIVLLLTTFIRVIILVILIVPLTRSHLLVLVVNGIYIWVLAGMLFCRSSQITLRVLLRIRILLHYFAFLILKSGDLLLGALHELVDLTLSLVLNGVISSLDIRWVDRILTTAPCLFGTLIGHLNPRLRSTRAWTWSSNLMVFPLFNILTLDHLIFYLIFLSISVDYVDSKCVKLIERPHRIILIFYSSLNIVWLSSFLHLVRTNKLITRLLFLVWMVLVVFETFLRLLLLRMVLLIRTITIFWMARILILLIFVKLLILPSRISCSVLLLILLSIWVVLLVNLYFVIELFQLILVYHIVSLIQILINLIWLVLRCSCGNIWICWLFPSMIQRVLLPIILLVLWLLLFERLLRLLVKVVMLL